MGILAATMGILAATMGILQGGFRTHFKMFSEQIVDNSIKPSGDAGWWLNSYQSPVKDKMRIVTLAS